MSTVPVDQIKSVIQAAVTAKDCSHIGVGSVLLCVAVGALSYLIECPPPLVASLRDSRDACGRRRRPTRCAG